MSSSTARPSPSALAGPYPAGTILGVDISHALHSLVPWTPPIGNMGTRTHVAPAASLSTAKRFKPTLNCNACVERKSRCDRGRPSCVACLRRGKRCTYNSIADVIACASQRSRPPRKPRNKKSALPPSTAQYTAAAGDVDNAAPTESTPRWPASPAHNADASPATLVHPEDQLSTPRPDVEPQPRLGSGLDLHSRQHTVLSTSGGLSPRHPFGGDWTHSGSLSEVISAMPSTQQCDTLVGAYFDFVHPLIPLFSPPDLRRENEHIWKSAQRDQESSDPTSVALWLAIFACGAQHAPSMQSHHTLVDVCISACHRALSLSLYLRLHSLRRCQTLLILCHCLMTDCRVTEAWTVAGLIQRQSYSLGLNRQDLVPFGVTSMEATQRKNLWIAIVHQDNVLSSLLTIPRSVSTGGSNTHMPVLALTESGSIEAALFSNQDDLQQHDAYLQAIWKLSAFVEEKKFYFSHAHNFSYCATPLAKVELISQLQQLGDSFGPPFGCQDTGWPENATSVPSALQGAEVMSLFHWHMTSICMESNQAIGMTIDIDGAVSAAHQGLDIFFAVARLAPGEINTWSTCSTMAYLQATMLAEVIRVADEQVLESQPRRHDLRLMLAKSDFDRYVDVLDRAGGNEQFKAVQTERIALLKQIRSKSKVA